MNRLFVACLLMLAACGRESALRTSSSWLTASSSFDGVGEGFAGPSGTHSVDVAPSDANLAVGPNHAVQIVNISYAVFDKAGSALYGPVPNNALWLGFGGPCERYNDGDPIVKYDRAADRWVFAQLSVTVTPYRLCVAVSQSGDPLGAYHRYEFLYGNVFPDYPKLAVWPDAYYVTYNMFRGSSFAGAKACAFDRAQMLTGAPATQQCFDLGVASLLPADADGWTPPPAGAPSYLLNFGSNSLRLWRFHVDWASPASSALTGPMTIAVAPFAPACARACIPQAKTGQKLDALGDRLMYRVAYRNFGSYEALTASHSVNAGSSVGVRWYELRNPAGTPAVYQQGTHAPDGRYRWMASAAMDHAGGIALGYSVSSKQMKPALRFTGRLAGDPLGTMQPEGSFVEGTGAQTGGLSRWGDYFGLVVDPADDCTYWFTGQYLKADGSFNWSTRLGSFRFPSCASSATSGDFGLSVYPSGRSTAPGGSARYTVNTSDLTGSAPVVSLSVSGLPAGVAGVFNPPSVTAGQSSVLTLSADGTAQPGTTGFAITGTSGSVARSTSAAITLLAAPVFTNGGFETGTLAGWTPSGIVPPIVVSGGFQSGFAAQVGSPSPYNGDSTLGQTFTVPANGGWLSLYFRPSCPDVIDFDQQVIELRDTSGTVLETLLYTCSNSGMWTRLVKDLGAYAGQTIELVAKVHDDGYFNDPSVMLLDEVAVEP